MLLALLGREVPEMPAAWVCSPQECRLLETLQPRVAPETMGVKKTRPGSCPDYHQSPGRSSASKRARAARTPDPRPRAETTARYDLGTSMAQGGIVDDCCYREFCGARVEQAQPLRNALLPWAWKSRGPTEQVRATTPLVGEAALKAKSKLNQLWLALINPRM